MNEECYKIAQAMVKDNIEPSTILAKMNECYTSEENINVLLKAIDNYQSYLSIIRGIHIVGFCLFGYGAAKATGALAIGDTVFFIFYTMLVGAAAYLAYSIYSKTKLIHSSDDTYYDYVEENNTTDSV